MSILFPKKLKYFMNHVIILVVMKEKCIDKRYKYSHPKSAKSFVEMSCSSYCNFLIFIVV